MLLEVGILSTLRVMTMSNKICTAMWYHKLIFIFIENNITTGLDFYIHTVIDNNIFTINK